MLQFKTVSCEALILTKKDTRIFDNNLKKKNKGEIRIFFKNHIGLTSNNFQIIHS